MRAKPVTEFKRRKRRPKVKFKVEDINYKNVELLKNFMNDKGKISPAHSQPLARAELDSPP